MKIGLSFSDEGPNSAVAVAVFLSETHSPPQLADRVRFSGGRSSASAPCSSDVDMADRLSTDSREAPNRSDWSSTAVVAAEPLLALPPPPPPLPRLDRPDEEEAVVSLSLKELLRLRPWRRGLVAVACSRPSFFAALDLYIS